MSPRVKLGRCLKCKDAGPINAVCRKCGGGLYEPLFPALFFWALLAIFLLLATVVIRSLR